MLVAAVLDPNASLPRQLRFALRVATARDASLICLLPKPEKSGRPEDDAEHAVVTKTLPHLRSAVAAADGYRLVEPGSAADDTSAENRSSDEQDLPTVTFDLIDGRTVESVLAATATHHPDTLVIVLRDSDLDQALARDRDRPILRRAPPEVVLLRLGDGGEDANPDVLVPVSRGPWSRRPLQLGRDLADAASGKLVAVFVEPPIGNDAEAVGERLLDQIVTRALGKDHGAVVEHVIVERAEPDGVVKACEEDEPGLVVLPISPFAALGDGDASRTARKLLRRRGDLDVALLRPALPMTNRLRQALEEILQRSVPQLEREQRVGLAERVQSSSAWNFDFVALISLSALIAAMGLVQDSAAVVIGAMLIAPLMTPILGVGLALVHGNIALARLAARSIIFGVTTAFVLGLLVGVLHTDLSEPTHEMLARGWPHPIDLVVAFVSGLAAAYATSRPNLVSALPGVAIAASLVPPLASSGLFASLGHGEAALGAFLLFLTNMVAIVLAAAFALWMVGIRSVKGTSRWTRIAGNGLIAVSLGLALYLGLAPEHDIRGRRVPDACAAAIDSHVEPRFRVIDLEVRPDQPHAWLVVRLGGPDKPGPELAAELGALARPHFSNPIRVRVVADWEATEPVPRK